jgi:hypothetical protein
MNQYPGGPQPQDPYYGQRPGDPYAPPPPQPSDPYFGQGADPYAPQADPYAPPADPAYAQQQAWYAQQQAWYAQQQAAQGQQRAPEARTGRGGAGTAVFGILLVLVGAWILFGDQVDLDLDLGQLWPVAAVALGSLMVIAAFIPRRRS